MGITGNFVHLHNHTEYSMLDGAARVGELAQAAAQQGMPALAMTDHGNVFGAYDFYKQVSKAGIKPIIGVEAYLAPGSRHERQRVKWAAGGEDDVSGGGAYTHITLLAETNEGLHNLFRLASLASLEGYYYKPRMDKEVLAQYSKGLIGFTGCASGEIQTLIRQGNHKAAVQSAGEFRDIFGQDNFYCELMNHGLDIENRALPGLLSVAQNLGLPLVATNDLHYTHAHDAAAHEVLLCVQSGKTLADPGRFKFDSSEFYLKSAEEMRRTWQQYPQACDNTLLIADRCNVTFQEGADLMPRFDVPEGHTQESWFTEEVKRGVARRYPNGPSRKVLDQIAYESTILTDKGFASYFLVTADFINWAKQQGIRVGPGRGSAAGSIVAYVMGITELDPLEHGLLFERFLNPERMSMPDIDIDFDERRRGDVIRYVTQKYGDDRVAQIVTYGTIKAKQAIRDAARVLGYPFVVGDKITKAMPPAVMGKEIPLSAPFDSNHPRHNETGEFRALYSAEPDVAKVVDTARGLENLKRQWGVHAAGVIMSREPLMDHIPIMRREQDGAIITQFDYPTCETIGLLKMDFLGLRNLTVMDDALNNIRINSGVEVVLEDLPLDDKPTYALLSAGDTLGVFQFDGGPMRALLRSMRPDAFEDISAVGALYRPGPMGANAHNEYADRKNGRKPVVPIHPELADALSDILGDTHGLIVYQEQVMAIAQHLAGYTLGAADLLRRAMGKKKKEVLDAEFVPFSSGMKERGFSQAAIKTLWDVLVPFSDYAFNKAHSACYGMVSYWTAYLKANYPAEYMAALLTSVRDDKDKSALYLAECRRMGIKVLPPDVNASAADFTPVGTDIRFGLTAVRNVGTSVVDSIVATRSRKSQYTDFYDFLDKVELTVCNKRVIESLVKAGAFDSFAHTRRGLMQVYADALESVVSLKRNEAVGQFDLFASLDSPAESADDSLASVAGVTRTAIPPQEWDKKYLLAQERDMLGLYVSDHPLFGVEHLLQAKADCSVAALTSEEGPADGSMLTIAGLVTGLQRKVTKTGNPWALGMIEDLEGAIETLFFPATYAQVGPALAEDTIVVVRGRVDRREDTARLIAMDLSLPDLAESSSGPLVLTLPARLCLPTTVGKMKTILTDHSGTVPVHVRLVSGQGQEQKVTVLQLADTLRVQPTTALLGDLKELLGPACVQ